MEDKFALPKRGFGRHYLDDKLTVGEYTRRLVINYLQLAFDNESGARLGVAPEFVHNMRVALRRTLVALRVFDKIIDAELKKHRAFVKSVIDVLGKVRDLDVQIEHGLKLKNSDDVIKYLEEKRKKARANLIRLFDSEEYAHNLQNLISCLKYKDQAAHNRPSNTRRTYKQIIEKQISKFQKCGEKLHEDSQPHDFHRLRIRCKRLRYTLDFFQPIYENVFNEMSKTMSSLQQDLGTINDLHVASTSLLEIVSKNLAGPSSRSHSEIELQSMRIRLIEIKKNVIKRLRKIDWDEFLNLF